MRRTVDRCWLRQRRCFIVDRVIDTNDDDEHDDDSNAHDTIAARCVVACIDSDTRIDEACDSYSHTHDDSAALLDDG